MANNKKYGYGGMRLDSLANDTASEPVSAMQSTVEETDQPKLFKPSKSAYSNVSSLSSNLSMTQALVKHESNGDYRAEPRDKKGNLISSAVGKYQFLWDTWGNEIMAATGVKSKEEFRNNPQAQDMYYENTYLPKHLNPGVARLKRAFGQDLDTKKLGLLYHFRGEEGASDYIKGIVPDKPEAYNKPISTYLNQYAYGGNPILQTDTVSPLRRKFNRAIAPIQEWGSVVNRGMDAILDQSHTQSMKLIGGDGTQSYSDLLNIERKKVNPVYNALDEINPKIINGIGRVGNYVLDPLNLVKKVKNIKQLNGVQKLRNVMGNYNNIGDAKQVIGEFAQGAYGGTVVQYAKGGMIKRADGSSSKRGLWDNIRANKGFGKKPTAEMLKQEKKISKHAEGGFITKNKDGIGAGAGMLSGALDSFNNTENPDMALSGVSGALTGAAAGAPLGAVGMGVGAVIGGVVSLFGASAKRKQYQEGLRKKNLAVNSQIYNESQGVLSSYMSKGNNGKYGYFAEGGEPQAPMEQYEVEKGEVVQGMDVNIAQSKQLASDLHHVKGKTHEEGGTIGSGGERIYSHRLIVPPQLYSLLHSSGIKCTEGSSFADVALKIGKLKGISEDKQGSSNYVSVNTAQLNLNKFTNILDLVFNTQEQMKKEQPELMKPIFAYGGMPKYANGVSFNNKGTNEVRRYQEMLNKKFGANLKVDGLWGKHTQSVYMNNIKLPGKVPNSKGIQTEEVSLSQSLPKRDNIAGMSPFNPNGFVTAPTLSTGMKNKANMTAAQYEEALTNAGIGVRDSMEDIIKERQIERKATDVPGYWKEQDHDAFIKNTYGNNNNQPKQWTAQNEADFRANKINRSGESLTPAQVQQAFDNAGVGVRPPALPKKKSTYVPPKTGFRGANRLLSEMGMFAYGGKPKTSSVNAPKPKPTAFAKLRAMEKEEAQFALNRKSFTPELLTNKLATIPTKLGVDKPTIPTTAPVSSGGITTTKGLNLAGIGKGLTWGMNNLLSNPDVGNYGMVGMGYLKDLKAVNDLDTSASRVLQNAATLNYTDMSQVAIANNSATFRNFANSSLNNVKGNQQAFANTLKANNQVNMQEVARRDGAIDALNRQNLQIGANNNNVINRANEQETAMRNEQIQQRQGAFNSLLGNIQGIQASRNQQNLDNRKIDLLSKAYDMESNGAISYSNEDKTVLPYPGIGNSKPIASLATETRNTSPIVTGLQSRTFNPVRPAVPFSVKPKAKKLGKAKR